MSQIYIPNQSSHSTNKKFQISHICPCQEKTQKLEQRDLKNRCLATVLIGAWIATAIIVITSPYSPGGPFYSELNDIDIYDEEEARKTFMLIDEPIFTFRGAESECRKRSKVNPNVEGDSEMNTFINGLQIAKINGSETTHINTNNHSELRNQTKYLFYISSKTDNCIWIGGMKDTSKNSDSDSSTSSSSSSSFSHSNKWYWVADDKNEEGQLQIDLNRPVYPLHWNFGEPNNFLNAGESCLQVARYSTKWNDAVCNDLCSVICRLK